MLAAIEGDHLATRVAGVEQQIGEHELRRAVVGRGGDRFLERDRYRRGRDVVHHGATSMVDRADPASRVVACATHDMSITDRIFPLCELLLGAAYADQELHRQEKTEIRALLTELAGERLVEVEACIASFEPARFDMATTAGVFAGDSEADREKLLLLVSTVIEADEEIDLAENDYLRALASALALPASALAGLAVDVEIEEIKDTFDAISKPA